MNSNLEKRLRKEADDLYFEACRLKWGGHCAICKKLYDKAHHFFPKGQYPHLRYDLNNGVNLCMDCHMKIHATGERKEIEEKIIKIRGEEWIRHLKNKKNNMPGSFVNKNWYRENIRSLKIYIYGK